MKPTPRNNYNIDNDEKHRPLRPSSCCIERPIVRAAGTLSGRTTGGFTIIELIIVMAIIGTLAGIGLPMYSEMTERARIARATSDIGVLQDAITGYFVDTAVLPDNLDVIGYSDFRDPWNNPYQYLNLAKTRGNGMARKDRFLVPLNSDYDLYSMGKDGTSSSALTAKASHDDIIRANDGGYIGLASKY